MFEHVGIEATLAVADTGMGVPEDEQDLAASSIMTVQLGATAFGAALAGLTVNLAGYAGGPGMDVANAARWLFTVFLLAPALCLKLLWPRAADD